MFAKPILKSYENKYTGYLDVYPTSLAMSVLSGEGGLYVNDHVSLGLSGKLGGFDDRDSSQYLRTSLLGVTFRAYKNEIHQPGFYIGGELYSSNTVGGRGDESMQVEVIALRPSVGYQLIQQKTIKQSLAFGMDIHQMETTYNGEADEARMRNYIYEKTYTTRPQNYTGFRPAVEYRLGLLF